MTRIAAQLQRERRLAERGWPDVAVLLAGVAVVAMAAALINRDHVDGPEQAVFGPSTTTPSCPTLLSGP